MGRPRLSRPDVVRKAGAEAGEGKHQQMRERSWRASASRSAVVSGCACGHRRDRYTTSSQDAGSGPGAGKEREQARRGKSTLPGAASPPATDEPSYYGKAQGGEPSRKKAGGGSPPAV